MREREEGVRMNKVKKNKVTENLGVHEGRRWEAVLGHARLTHCLQIVDRTVRVQPSAGNVSLVRRKRTRGDVTASQ